MHAAVGTCRQSLLWWCGIDTLIGDPSNLCCTLPLFDPILYSCSGDFLIAMSPFICKKRESSVQENYIIVAIFIHSFDHAWLLQCWEEDMLFVCYSVRKLWRCIDNRWVGLSVRIMKENYSCINEVLIDCLWKIGNLFYYEKEIVAKTKPSLGLIILLICPPIIRVNLHTVAHHTKNFGTSK